MKLFTRIDFDGLICAVFLAEKGIVDEYEFVHPREIQAGEVKITQNDVLANVPYFPGAGLWFDHHSSELERLEIEKLDFEGDCREVDSAAQVIWDYYGGVETFGERFLPLLEAVNKADSGRFLLDDILHAEDWILIAFIVDPKTGLYDFNDYRIDNHQFTLDLIDYCRTKPIEEILEIPDVKERADRYNEQQILYKDSLRKNTRDERNIVITNLLTEDALYCGNRFIVFASHPDQNIEIRMTWDDSKKNVVFSCGHSILNRTSKTDVGKLMLKYGGGGHKQVGSCRVPVDDWERIFEEILQQMLADG